jgi:hypothetical protein
VDYRATDREQAEAKDVPQVNRDFQAAPARHRDEKIGFRESTVPLVNSSKPLNFTGIAFFCT